MTNGNCITERMYYQKYDHQCDIVVQHYKSLNCILNNILTTWKNKIDNNPLWDDAKKITNEYEFIFSSFKSYHTSTLTVKRPLSRAYFKLWEMLHRFSVLESQKSYNTAHIAEGPGGFIEAICDYSDMYNVHLENIYGITLIEDNMKVPKWKLKENYLSRYPIHIDHGTENNGDMYVLENIDDFVNRVVNKCDFITADGGFDFSNDFNRQEEDSYSLMLSEMYTAIRIQNTNGNFILKVFDLFSLDTLYLISIVSVLYESFSIVKPITSRPANSEKYILFQTFKSDESLQAEVLSTLREAISTKNKNIVASCCHAHTVIKVLKQITYYNIYYTCRQMLYIKKTLSTMQKIASSTHNNAKSHIKTTLHTNKQKCKLWCQKFKLKTIE